MKSDPRLNWHFESSSRYSGLSRCVPSSSHRLPRSSRRELGLFVSSPTSSSRQLPRSSRRDQTCRPATEFVSSTHHALSSSTRVKCRVRLVELWDRLVVDQFHLQISKKYRSWEGPRTWFSCKMAAVDNRERSLDDLKASLRDGVQHLR